MKPRPGVPQLRTGQNFAIALAVGAVVAIGIAVLGAEKLEAALDSEVAAIVVLGVWCVAGAGAAITGLIDAYIKPEAEELELATTVAATVFALLALVAVTGIVVGAAGVA